MPHFDQALGCWVQDNNHAKDIAKERGLVDVREFAEGDRGHEVVARIAEENRRENLHSTYSGYEDAVHKALYLAEQGENFERVLADEIREADLRNETNRKPAGLEERLKRGD